MLKLTFRWADGFEFTEFVDAAKVRLSWVRRTMVIHDIVAIECSAV